MFLGRHAHSVDAKGRMAIPAKFREPLGARAVVTRGVDPCLSLYPLPAWERLAEQVNALSIGDPDARAFKRLVFGEAADVDLDAQGRVLLPPELRRYAGIEREVVVVGVHGSIELWSPERWDGVNAAVDQNAAEFASRLSALI